MTQDEWIKINNPYKLKPGDTVLLDKDHNNSSIVVLHSLTPNHMFARVSSTTNSDKWEVMTRRLKPNN